MASGRYRGTGSEAGEAGASAAASGAAAWASAAREGIGGQASTPYLLDYIRRATDGRSLDANVALYRNNIRLACEVAAALVEAAPANRGA